MSTVANLMLATMWFSLTLITAWAFLPACVCLGAALLTAALGLDHGEREGE